MILHYNNKPICKCINCKKIFLTYSKSCIYCFDKANYLVSRYGKIVEFSKRDNIIFCIGEFENKIRIIGTVKTNLKKPEIGMVIKLKTCQQTNNKYDYVFNLI